MNKTWSSPFEGVGDESRLIVSEDENYKILVLKIKLNMKSETRIILAHGLLFVTLILFKIYFQRNVRKL